MLNHWKLRNKHSDRSALLWTVVNDQFAKLRKLRNKHSDRSALLWTVVNDHFAKVDFKPPWMYFSITIKI